MTDAAMYTGYKAKIISTIVDIQKKFKEHEMAIKPK